MGLSHGKHNSVVNLRKEYILYYGSVSLSAVESVAISQLLGQYDTSVLGEAL